MANASFTRDEVILALDVLYFSGNKHLSAKSTEIIELSELLNLLPVHASGARRSIFRNPSGVAKQIQSFYSSYQKGIKDVNVGRMFYLVAEEFDGRLEELHLIALAIRKNMDAYNKYMFGNFDEAINFPEGALLGHLHQIVERRDGARLNKESICEICHINPDEIYGQSSNLLTSHLTINILDLDDKRRYNEKEFITVCPNCHAALHHQRPWRTKETCKEILI